MFEPKITLSLPYLCDCPPGKIEGSFVTEFRLVGRRYGYDLVSAVVICRDCGVQVMPKPIPAIAPCP